MTPEKFFDYLEGKLPPPERERLERALIHDPELQQQFVAARQIHRTLQRPPNESSATTRAGARGRQLAAAFAVLVVMNVGIGLYFIFRAAKLPPEVQRAREEAIRQQLQSSLEKSASAAFTPPKIGSEPIHLNIPANKQNEIAQAIVDAATRAGGSGTKGLPDDTGVSVFVLVPASAEAQFWKTLTALGAAPSPAKGTPKGVLPNEPIHLQVVLSTPR
jgi:hypothetical protein